MRKPREVIVDNQLYTIRTYCELRGISDYATIRSIARSVHTFCEINPSKKAQGRELQRLVKYRLLTKISPPPGIKPRPWAGAQYTINDKQYSVRSYCESQGLTDLGQIYQLRDHINYLRAYRKNIPDYMFEQYLVYRVGEALGHSLCVCPTWNGQKLSTREFRLQPPAAPIQPPKASPKTPAQPQSTQPQPDKPTHVAVNELIQSCAAMLNELNKLKAEKQMTQNSWKEYQQEANTWLTKLQQKQTELQQEVDARLAELQQNQTELKKQQEQVQLKLQHVDTATNQKQKQNDDRIAMLSQLVAEKHKQIQELLQA